MAKKAKNKKGRKSKFNPKYAEKARELCAEKGYTDKNLAVHFKVSEATINRWKKEFSEFCESLKKGKDEFDSRVVEQSLLKRAAGYSYVETTRELQDSDSDSTVVDEDEGSEIPIQTLVVTKKVTKHMAPDVTAQIFWLKNRQPQRWSDKKEIDHRIEDVSKPLTLKEMKERIVEAEAAGTGIDNRSIEGNNGNAS